MENLTESKTPQNPILNINSIYETFKNSEPTSLDIRPMEMIPTMPTEPKIVEDHFVSQEEESQRFILSIKTVHSYWNSPSCDASTTPKKMATLISESLSRKAMKTNYGRNLNQPSASDYEHALNILWWRKKVSPLEFHPEIDGLIFKRIHSLSVMMSISILHTQSTIPDLNVDGCIKLLVETWNKDGRKSTKDHPLFCAMPGTKKEEWRLWIKKAHKHLSKHKDSILSLKPDYEEGGFLSGGIQTPTLWELLNVNLAALPRSGFNSASYTASTGLVHTPSVEIGSGAYTGINSDRERAGLDEFRRVVREEVQLGIQALRREMIEKLDEVKRAMGRFK